MKSFSAAILFSILLPGFCFAVVRGQPFTVGPNEPLPMPMLTLEEVQHLKTVGTLLVSEVDINHSFVIKGVRYEGLSARQIIMYKQASAASVYGIRVGIRDPSQSCAERICAVFVYEGLVQKKLK